MAAKTVEERVAILDEKIAKKQSEIEALEGKRQINMRRKARGRKLSSALVLRESLHN